MIWVLPWLLKWQVTSPQSAWRPRPRPPLQSCLCISSWPALQLHSWTRHMWCCDRISSWNVWEKVLKYSAPTPTTTKKKNKKTKTNDLQGQKCCIWICLSAGLFCSLWVEFESLKCTQSHHVFSLQHGRCKTAWRWYPTEINNEKTYTGSRLPVCLGVVWGTTHTHTHTPVCCICDCLFISCITLRSDPVVRSRSPDVFHSSWRPETCCILISKVKLL